EIIRRWIEAGAPGVDKALAPRGPDLTITDEDRKFWAFQTPVRPKVPAIKTSNPIDAFLLTALQKTQLTMSREAAPLRLLRLISFRSRTRRAITSRHSTTRSKSSAPASWA